MRTFVFFLFLTAMVAVAQTFSNGTAAQSSTKQAGAKDAADATPVFSDKVADEVIGRVREGLRVHSRRLLLSAFDDDKMDGYRSFAEQVDSFFNRYDAFRVQFRIASVTSDGERGVVLVDAEVEETPADGGAAIHKRDQLRFEIGMGRQGWRVVNVRDRRFFS